MNKISFIVLSYNRPVETKEVIHNLLYDIDDSKNLQKEIIVINNASTVDYSQVVEFIKNNDPTIKYIISNENKGVSGGRNLGISHATGDYLVFIDDDAIFKEKDIINKIENKYKTDQSLAIIGFALYNYYSNESDHPVKKKSKLSENEFYNNIFWGGACVILKKIFHEIGMFDEKFFYGMEEYDLSYRVLDKGYKILFTQDISVLHKVALTGREINIVKYSRMFVNKCTIAYRYLPIKYVISHIFMWSGFFLLKSRGGIIAYIKNLKKLLSEIRLSNRNKISKDALSYIKSVSGRLTY